MNFLKRIFKKYPIVITLIILSAIISVFKSLNFKTNIMGLSEKKNFNENDAKEAVLAVKAKYGVDMARIVEKMLRWETGHFKSGQYKNTGSAGMEIGKWSNLNKNEIEPNVYQAHDADKSDGIDSFIIWKHPKYAALYLADYIQRFNGNFARWNTTNPAKQVTYRNKVNSITPKFV